MSGYPMVAFLGFAVLVGVFCYLLTPQRRFYVAALIALPQFHIHGFPITLATAWMILMAICAVIDHRIVLARKAVVLPVFALVGIYLIAQLWSAEPFAAENVFVILNTLIFAVLIVYALTIFSASPGALTPVLHFLAPSILLQSVLIIVFRISPSLESSFLHSSLADMIVGASAGGLYTGFPNNVLDPAKSGGLFVNGNVGSLCCGVSALVIFMAVRLGASRLYLLLALLAMMGVVASGSKTGLALGVVLPISAIILAQIFSGQGKVALLPIITLVALLVVAAPIVLGVILPKYTEDASFSLSTRQILWDAARTLFESSPILGLGFGGWIDQIGALIGTTRYPPHNLIIAAWANGGIACAAIVLLFFIAAGVTFFRRLGAHEKQPIVLASGLMVVMWVFIHGMGDNTTIFGDTKIMILVAIAIGVTALQHNTDASLAEGPPIDAQPNGAESISAQAKSLNY